MRYALGLVIMALTVSPAFAGARSMVKEVTVTGSLDDVWAAWTTEEGLRFVSRKSRVELRRGGPYEWFLDLPPDENGKRGGEGATVLAFLPRQMLAFSWTFPPDVPELRNADETYQVVVFFDDNADGTVTVRLNAHEWREGDAWDRGYAYFDKAWSAVLDRLKQAIEAQ
jgi:uncharacterized protein YndB with AHSA1/START domain